MFGKGKVSTGAVLKAARKGTSISDLLESVPEENRQSILDEALLHIIEYSSNQPNIEVPVAALVKAGADPDAEIKGHKGFIFARAISNQKSPAVIKSLYEGGASFKNALFIMKINGYADSTVERLNAYRENFGDKPATAVDKTPVEKAQAVICKEETDQPLTAEALLKLQKLVSDLHEQVADVTSQLGTLTEEVRILKTAQPEASQKNPAPVTAKSAALRR